MKKLSLIAIATVIASAAGAAEPQIYMRADYSYTMRETELKTTHIKTDTDILKGSVGVGVKYNNVVVEIPDVNVLSTLYLGYSFDITKEISLTPQAAYRFSDTNGYESSGYGLKLEGEYKLSPGFSLAANVGYTASSKDSPKTETNAILLSFGGKFYF